MELIKFLNELKNNKYLTLNQLENDINKLKTIVDNPNLKFDYVKPKRLKNYINDLRESTESAAAKVRDIAEKSFSYVANTIPKFTPKTDDDMYLLLGFLLSIDDLDDFDFENEDELLALIGMLLIDNPDDNTILKKKLKEIIDKSKITNDPDEPIDPVESPSDTIARLVSMIRQNNTKANERYEIMKKEIEKLKGSDIAAKIIGSLHDLDKNRLAGQTGQITALQTELQTTQEDLERTQAQLDDTLQQLKQDREIAATELGQAVQLFDNLQGICFEARAAADAAAEEINKIRAASETAIAAAQAAADQAITAVQGERQATIDAQARAHAAISAARANADRQIADAILLAANAETAANQAAENAAAAQDKAEKERIKSLNAIAAATEATTAAALSKAQLELAKEALRIVNTQGNKKDATIAAEIALYTSNIATLEAQNLDLESQITNATTDIDRCQHELDEARAIAFNADERVQYYITENAAISLERDKARELTTNTLAALAAAQKSQVAAQNAEAAALANLETAKALKYLTGIRARAALAAKKEALEAKKNAESEKTAAQSSQENAETRAATAEQARLLAEKRTEEAKEESEKATKGLEEALAQIQETLTQTQAELARMMSEKTLVSKTLGAEIVGYTKEIEEYKKKLSGHETVSKTNEKMGEILAKLTSKLQEKDKEISKMKDGYKHDRAIYLVKVKELSDAQNMIASLRGANIKRIEILEQNNELELELLKRERSIKTLEEQLDELSVKYLVSVAESDTATLLLDAAIKRFPKTVVERARDDSAKRGMGDKWKDIKVESLPAPSKASLGRASILKIEKAPRSTARLTIAAAPTSATSAVPAGVSAAGLPPPPPPTAGVSAIDPADSTNVPIIPAASAASTDSTDSTNVPIIPVPLTDSAHQSELSFGFSLPPQTTLDAVDDL